MAAELSNYNQDSMRKKVAYERRIRQYLSLKRGTIVTNFTIPPEAAFFSLHCSASMLTSETLCSAFSAVPLKQTY